SGHCRRQCARSALPHQPSHFAARVRRRSRPHCDRRREGDARVTHHQGGSQTHGGGADRADLRSATHIGGKRMKLLKSIVRPNKVDEVKDALAKLNIAGMTVTEVRGHGKQKGHTAIYRGKEYNVSLLPKMEIEVVVADAVADDVVKAIVTAARTGEIGDGRVFVLPVLESYRIRTGEREAESSRREGRRPVQVDAGRTRSLPAEARASALLVAECFDRIESGGPDGGGKSQKKARGGGG